MPLKQRPSGNLSRGTDLPFSPRGFHFSPRGSPDSLHGSPIYCLSLPGSPAHLPLLPSLFHLVCQIGVTHFTTETGYAHLCIHRLLLDIHLFWLDQGRAHVRPPPHPPAGRSLRREGSFSGCSFSCLLFSCCWQRQEFLAVGPVRQEDLPAFQVSFHPVEKYFIRANRFPSYISVLPGLVWRDEKHSVCANKKAYSGKQLVIRHLPNTPSHFRKLIATTYDVLANFFLGKLKAKNVFPNCLFFCHDSLSKMSKNFIRSVWFVLPLGVWGRGESNSFWDLGYIA